VWYGLDMKPEESAVVQVLLELPPD
jgi:hypothetical protein